MSRAASRRACRPRLRRQAAAWVAEGVAAPAADSGAAATWCSRVIAARCISDPEAGCTRHRFQPAPLPVPAGRVRAPPAAGAAARGVVAERRATATEQATTNATARQVTYTANIEIDRKALRAQVFNEGWRIMKNRFYDGEDARRRLAGDEEDVRAAARVSRRRRRASHRHDDDDRTAQRLAHRRQWRRRGQPADASDALSRLRCRRRYVRILQGRSHLQGRSRRSGLPQDQGRALHHLGGRPRSEDGRQLLAGTSRWLLARSSTLR